MAEKMTVARRVVLVALADAAGPREQIRLAHECAQASITGPEAVSFEFCDGSMLRIGMTVIDPAEPASDEPEETEIVYTAARLESIAAAAGQLCLMAKDHHHGKSMASYWALFGSLRARLAELMGLKDA